jgi:hypothetical protein
MQYCPKLLSLYAPWVVEANMISTSCLGNDFKIESLIANAPFDRTIVLAGDPDEEAPSLCQTDARALQASVAFVQSNNECMIGSASLAPPMISTGMSYFLSPLLHRIVTGASKHGDPSL